MTIDNEVRDELIQLMELDPWNEFSVHSLIKRVMRSREVILRVLQNNSVFLETYHSDGVNRWMLQGSFFTNREQSREKGVSSTARVDQ